MIALCLVLWYWIHFIYPACSASIHHLDLNNTSAGEKCLVQRRARELLRRPAFGNTQLSHTEAHLSSAVSAAAAFCLIALLILPICIFYLILFFILHARPRTQKWKQSRQTVLSSDPKQMERLVNTCDAYSQSCVNTKHEHLDTR